MRINVYTEELYPAEMPRAEIVTAHYVSSRTGDPMTNFGLRIYLKSHPDLHFVPPRDDDRSAVTFWCGGDLENVRVLLRNLMAATDASALSAHETKEG